MALDNKVSIHARILGHGPVRGKLATELAIGSLTLEKGLGLTGGWKGLYLTQDTNPTILNGTITVNSADSTINDAVTKGGLIIQGGSLRVKQLRVVPIKANLRMFKFRGE